LTLSVVNDHLQLDMNMNMLEPMPLRNGAIADLRELGRFRDTEVGRITGNEHEYIFTIKDNRLYLRGEGKVSNITASLSSNTKLSYDRYYPWFKFLDIPEREKREYASDFEGIEGPDVLTTDNNNPYGAVGGVHVQVDDQDNVSFSVNITTNTPVTFEKGVVLNLELKRSLTPRTLYDINGSGLEYQIDLMSNNNISIDGGGDFTTIIDPPGSGGTVAPPDPTPSPVTVSSDIIHGLCYIYTYDQRNNLVEKKYPEKVGNISCTII